MAAFAIGVLTIAFALPGIGGHLQADRQAEIRRLRLLGLWFVSPALVLVWALGISLAIEGHWLDAPWLHAKIVLVVILSALHGLQSVRLRRLSSGNPPRKADPRWWPLPVVAILLAIIGLAVGKFG